MFYILRSNLKLLCFVSFDVIIVISSHFNSCLSHFTSFRRRAIKVYIFYYKWVLEICYCWEISWTISQKNIIQYLDQILLQKKNCLNVAYLTDWWKNRHHLGKQAFSDRGNRWQGPPWQEVRSALPTVVVSEMIGPDWNYILWMIISLIKVWIKEVILIYSSDTHLQNPLSCLGLETTSIHYSFVPAIQLFHIWYVFVDIWHCVLLLLLLLLLDQNQTDQIPFKFFQIY